MNSMVNGLHRQYDEQNSRLVENIAVVATLGLLSAVLGFIVEVIKPQLYEVMVDVDVKGGCIYPSKSVLVILGILAVVALFGIRVYCHGIQSHSSMVQLPHYFSWVAWFVAIISYVVGLLMIKFQGGTLEYSNSYQSYYSCNVVKPGIFGAGATFALACIILEIMYLVVAHHHNDHKTVAKPSTQPSTIAMC